MNELKLAAERLIEKHGSLRKAARALKIDPAYLSNLRHGHRENPSDGVLRKLGLRREVTLRRIDIDKSVAA